jgi:probable HAF family extracellular repeat protein
MQRRKLIAVPCAALLLNALPVAAAVKYSITSIQAVELGTLGGDESVANDINDLGHIVGWARNASTTRRAFLYRNNSMQDITFGWNTVAEARGINNLTQVVGNFRSVEGDPTHAFYWDEVEQFELLDEVYPDEPPDVCGTGADAAAINDSGVITGTHFVGCSPPYPDYPHPSRWSSWSGTVEHISHPMVDGFAADINATGAIAGWGTQHPGDFHDGFLWNAGIYESAPIPLGPQPVFAPSLRLFGVNDQGLVVGEVIAGGNFRAIIWNGSSLFSAVLPVQTGSSSAYEINNQRFSVGNGRLGLPFVIGTRNRAAVWHPDIGITLMPLPPGGIPTTENCVALSVNNRSSDATDAFVQAVGYCTMSGKKKAVLWNIQTKKVITR